jgi:hypothetical protein
VRPVGHVEAVDAVAGGFDVSGMVVLDGGPREWCACVGLLGFDNRFVLRDHCTCALPRRSMVAGRCRYSGVGVSEVEAFSRPRIVGEEGRSIG